MYMCVCSKFKNIVSPRRSLLKTIQKKHKSRGHSSFPRHTTVYIVFFQVSIPPVDTVYWCHPVKLPTFDKKHHIVKVRTGAFFEKKTIYINPGSDKVKLTLVVSCLRKLQDNCMRAGMCHLMKITLVFSLQKCT